VEKSAQQGSKPNSYERGVYVNSSEVKARMKGPSSQRIFLHKKKYERGVCVNSSEVKARMKGPSSQRIFLHKKKNMKEVFVSTLLKSRRG